MLLYHTVYNTKAVSIINDIYLYEYKLFGEKAQNESKDMAGNPLFHRISAQRHPQSGSAGSRMIVLFPPDSNIYSCPFDL